jgi:hypothetical protein
MITSNHGEAGGVDIGLCRERVRANYSSPNVFKATYYLVRICLNHWHSYMSGYSVVVQYSPPPSVEISVLKAGGSGIIPVFVANIL